MTIKVPHTQLLFNRVVKGKLPILERKAKVVNRHAEATQNDKSRKESAKRSTDSRRKAKNSEIEVGDSVFCQLGKQNKFSTRFNPVPYKVIRITGTRVTTRNNNKFITCNVSFFKKVRDCYNQEEPDDDLEIPATDESNSQQSVHIYQEDQKETENKLNAMGTS